MKLLDRTIKIVTVHASTAIRQLLNGELRACGYLDVVGVPDLSTAVSMLEADPIHWLIMPLLIEDRFNTLQLLRRLTEDPALMDLRVSLMVDGQVDPLMIAKAFDLGLLSLHRSMQTKVEVSAEFKELMQLLTHYRDTPSLVSATYLRRHLLETERREELLRFEKALFQVYAGHRALLLPLTEAHLLNKQPQIAKQLGRQALLIAPQLKPELQTLFKRYETQLDPSALPLEKELLGIRSCLLIEPDQGTRSEIEGLLKQLGIERIAAFADGPSATEWLQAGNQPELVILEWQLESLPAPLLVQHLRELLGPGTPISVMNRDLQEHDRPLLRELGASDHIKKPIIPQTFLQEVIWLIYQDRAPSEPPALLQKIRQAMAQQDFERLAAYTKRYIDSPKTSLTDKMLMQAELAYFRGNYYQSKAQAIEALKLGPATVEILNLLGKALMKLREFALAQSCLENADFMSPKNVRRICNIAEVQLEMGDDAGFNRQLAAAQAIDGDHEAVAELETKAALVHGDITKAKSLMQALPSLLNIVSFTNNRAIALIRNDRFEDGIRLYREAIQAVPDDQSEVQATLHYNLGLALARMSRLGEAQEHIDRAADLKSEKIQSRVTSLQARLQKAIDGQKPLKLLAAPSLTLNEASPRAAARDYDELMMALTIGPGDMGCHKIYVETLVSQQLQELVDRPLRLKRRSGAAPKKVS